MNQVFLNSLAPALLSALAGLFTVNAVELLSPQHTTAQGVSALEREALVNSLVRSGRAQGADPGLISLQSQ